VHALRCLCWIYVCSTSNDDCSVVGIDCSTGDSLTCIFQTRMEILLQDFRHRSHCSFGPGPVRGCVPSHQVRRHHPLCRLLLVRVGVRAGVVRHVLPPLRRRPLPMLLRHQGDLPQEEEDVHLSWKMLEVVENFDWDFFR